MLTREINPATKKLSQEEISEREYVIASLKASLSNKTKIDLNSKKSKESFYTAAQIIRELLIKRVQTDQEKTTVNLKIIHQPFYQPTINTFLLSERISVYLKS